jgi:hypothetical protein
MIVRETPSKTRNARSATRFRRMVAVEPWPRRRHCVPRTCSPSVRRAKSSLKMRDWNKPSFEELETRLLSQRRPAPGSAAAQPSNMVGVQRRPLLHQKGRIQWDVKRRKTQPQARPTSDLAGRARRRTGPGDTCRPRTTRRAIVTPPAKISAIRSDGRLRMLESTSPAAASEYLVMQGRHLMSPGSAVGACRHLAR